MSDYEPTSPLETLCSDPESAKTSRPTVVRGLEGAASASPLPPASSSGWPLSATMAGRADEWIGADKLGLFIQLGVLDDPWPN